MWLRHDRVVAHFVNRYVELSENWIHTQIKHLHRWSAYVVANATANLDDLLWKPPYFARWEVLRGPFRRIDDMCYTRWEFAPSHYLAIRWAGARLIHAHFGPQGVEAVPLARALDIPLITTFYGYDLSKLPREDPEWMHRYRTLFDEGACFLVEGPHMAEQLADLGCPRMKIRTQHLGMETHHYPFESRGFRGKEPLKVLMAGRFVEKKGLRDGIRAFSSFLEKGGSGTLTVIGDDSPYKNGAALRPVLEALVHALGIEAHVKFRGFVKHHELRKALYNHHVLLAPSRTASSGDNEGGAPVVLIEAQATGMPVVSTWHCDIPEVVQHEKTGLLTAEGNVEGLANHLLTLYREPRAVRVLGKAGHERMRDQYNAKAQGRALDAIYDSVLKGQLPPVETQDECNQPYSDDIPA